MGSSLILKLLIKLPNIALPSSKLKGELEEDHISLSMILLTIRTALSTKNIL
jgi:hypothetical protein